MFRLLITALATLCIAVGAFAGIQPKKSKAPAKAQPVKDAASDSKTAGEKPSEPVETVNPGVFLLRDPLVQAELQLTTKQKAAAADLAAEFNESIWRFRDASIDSEVALKEARTVNSQMEPRLSELLNPRQRDRLTGIALQIQGTDALGFSSTVQKLSLTSEQQERIAKLSASAQTAIKKVRAQAVGSSNLAELNRQVEKLQVGLQRDLQAVLTKSQRERWAELRGSPVELSKLQPLTARAPELRGVNTWVNSEPLTLEELRGKVVALHFWTFG